MSNDTPCAAALEERNGTAMACQASGSHACVHSFSGLNCRYSLKSGVQHSYHVPELGSAPPTRTEQLAILF